MGTHFQFLQLQEAKLQQRRAKQTAWDAVGNKPIPSQPFPHTVTCTDQAVTAVQHTACTLCHPSPSPASYSPHGSGDKRGPGCPMVPALIGHLAAPMGLSPSLLPMTHESPPLPPLFSARCKKGEFDLNLSARIRVQSRSPLPSTEPHQGCEAASATAAFFKRGSVRAATITGSKGCKAEKGQCQLHSAKAAAPACKQGETPTCEDQLAKYKGLRGKGLVGLSSCS